MRVAGVSFGRERALPHLPFRFYSTLHHDATRLICLSHICIDMEPDSMPAIVRAFTDADQEAEVLSTPYDGVSHRRGWGDSGYRVETVDHDCPADHCAFDRMIRRVDVSPETPTEVRYWCLNPNCQHFVRDELSYACHGSYPQRPARTPAVTDAP